MTLLLLALSYLLGATPTSYWVGKAFHGLDLREHGSGNLGATNSFRVLGWKSALPVVVVDDNFAIRIKEIESTKKKNSGS